MESFQTKAVPCSCLVGLFLVVSARSGMAQTPTNAQRETEPLIQQGISERRNMHDDLALPIFRRALALSPSDPRVLAHLGLTEQAMGLWLDAEGHIRIALENAENTWIKSHATELKQALSIVENHLGWLEVSTDVPTGQVFLNGRKACSLPCQALRVVAGTNLIRVESEGRVAVERDLMVVAAAHFREFVALPEKQRVPAIPPASSAPLSTNARARPMLPDDPRRRTERGNDVGWAALGLGVIGLGVGAYMGWRTFDLKDHRDANCDAGRCNADAVAYDRQARSSAMWSNILLGAGLVSTGIGSYLLLTPTSGASMGTRGAWNGGVRLSWQGQW